MADLTGFETFTKRLLPLGKQPLVTIQKKGIISLNKSAYIALGSPKLVELLFNPHTQVVAIRSTLEELPHAYRLRTVGAPDNPTTFLIGGTSFTRHYDISTSESVRWEPKSEPGLLLIDLTEPGTVVTSARGARSSSGSEEV